MNVNVVTVLIKRSVTCRFVIACFLACLVLFELKSEKKNMKEIEI